MRFKARLVACGFSQIEGIDYHRPFFSIVRMTSLWTIFSLVANLDLELQQMDVNTTFFDGNSEEEIYMNQPKGYVKFGDKKKVCQFIKSIYGLKQSPKPSSINKLIFISLLPIF